MRYKRLLAFSAVYLLWGWSYMAIRCVVQAVPPLLAAGIRYSLAGLLLLLFCLTQRGNSMPGRRQFLNAIGTGIVALGVSFGAVFWSSSRLPSWVVGLLLATSFFWTYLGECWIARRAPHSKMVATILVGLLAILLITRSDTGKSGASAAPMLIVLVAACVWSGAVLAIKHLKLPQSPFQTAALQMSSAGLLLLVISACIGEWSRLPASPRILQWRPMLAMSYLVIAGSIVAFSAFHWLIAHERPHLVSTSSYVNPLVALVTGVAISGEDCSPVQVAGAILLLLSIGTVWQLQRTVSTVPQNGIQRSRLERCGPEAV